MSALAIRMWRSAYSGVDEPDGTLASSQTSIVDRGENGGRNWRRTRSSIDEVEVTVDGDDVVRTVRAKVSALASRESQEQLLTHWQRCQGNRATFQSCYTGRVGKGEGSLSGRTPRQSSGTTAWRTRSRSLHRNR